MNEDCYSKGRSLNPSMTLLHLWTRFLVAAALLLAAPVAAAQGVSGAGGSGAGTPGGGGASQLPPGEDLKVYLQTIGPGELSYEKYGHNSLVVEDVRTGVSASFNYGIFLEPNPTVFLSGRLIYRLAIMRADAELQDYRRFGRRVWRQELRFTPAQRRELLEFLQWNCAPENMDYHYNYYRDNCSTRVRDAIDRVLDGQLRAAATTPIDETFRSIALRFSSASWSLWAGIQMAQGLAVDAPITVWEEMYIPGVVRREVAKLSITLPDGTQAPLVVAEEEFPPLDGVPEILEPPTAPSWMWWHLIAGMLLAGVILELGRTGRRKLLCLVASLWLLFNGLAGSLLVYLWWGSEHADSAANMNLLYYTPLDLLLLPLFALAVLGGKCQRAAFGLAYLIALIALVGLLLELIPALAQMNGSLVAVALPVHFAIALSLREATRAKAEVAPATT